MSLLSWMNSPMAAGQFRSHQGHAPMEDLWGRSIDGGQRIPAYQLSKFKFDHTDIRFTTKGETLYAIALGWPPDNQVLIKSLASTAPQYQRQIRKVELLGAKGDIKWTRTAEGLRISVPQDPPCHYAYAFKISPA